MSEHTPGPWEMRETGTWPGTNHHLGIYSDHHPTGRIALVEGFDIDAANARLIAAAPDLLAALKLIEAVYRKNVVAVGESSSVLDAVQVAIEKAEGLKP